MELLLKTKRNLIRNFLIRQHTSQPSFHFFHFHVFSFCNKLGTYDNQAVVLSTAEVKYEPEERATTYFTAYEGWDLRILNESTGWVKVQRPDGLIGWLPRDLVERI